MSIPSFQWPDSALLEQLLATGLLRRWLQARIEQALMADQKPSDGAGLEALQQEAMGPTQAHWVQWCEHQGVSQDCLDGLSSQAAQLESCKRTWFEQRAYGQFLGQGSGLDQVWFSVLQTTDADLAQEWFFKLQDAESGYADLASESLGFERFSGGNVGPVRVRDLHSPLDLLLRRASPGIVQPPLLSPAGRYWLVRLNQRVPARWEGPLVDELIADAYRQWLNVTLVGLLERCPSPGQQLTLEPPDA